MEENVALDSSKQKQFVKSIKGIKKLIKKNDTDGVAGKNVKVKGKDGKVQKHKRKPRGLVYLGHIPHGFYENEMTQYFKQFGVVTNVRVIRSKRTGRSKGHAFVEFRDPDVAEVVAETMNNYLMGKRLIKAATIPPEKQRRFALRKRWNTEHNPTNEIRLKMKKAYNTNLDEDGEIKKARKILSTFRKNIKKLNDLGINYDFFSPVDVPEVLQGEQKVKQEKPEVNNDDKAVKTNKKPQKEKEGKLAVKDEKIIKKKDTIKTEKVKSNNKEKVKSNKKEIVVKEEQRLKEQKLKDAGVKSVENFIKVSKPDSDSDSEYEFDSDEFDKMLENEGDNDSELESADENDEESEENDSEPDESEEDEANDVQNKMLQKATNNKKVKQQDVKQQNSQKMKRGANQKPFTAPKKSKFENKNTQKLNKKQFKKRK